MFSYGKWHNSLFLGVLLPENHVFCWRLLVKQQPWEVAAQEF